MLIRHKILALVVALAVLFVPVAFAEDAQVTPAEEQAVNHLAALGIMTGDEEGLRPESNVTRAEFAAMIVRMMGLNDGMPQADDLPFDDISDSWAVNEICLVTELHYMNGVGGGKFDPQGNVTCEQAVKVMVSILGYEPLAEEAGGYPTGYLSVANQNVLLKNVQAQSDAEMTRGSLAVLIENALETPMLVPVYKQDGEMSYAKSGTGDTEEQTILEDVLRLQKVYALVTEVRETARMITARSDEIPGGEKAYPVAEGVDFLDTADLYVYLYIDQDETVVAIVPARGENEVLYDFICEVNGDAENGGVYYPNAVEEVRLLNSGNVYDIDQDAVNIYYNDKIVGSEAVPFVGNFCRLVLNDNEVVKMELYSLTEGGILAQLSDSSIRYTKGEETAILREVDYVRDFFVVIDGRVSDYDHLELDMVFDYWCSEDMTDMLIVASSQYLEGVLDEIGDESLTVEGVESNVDTDHPLYYSINGSTYETGDDAAKLLDQHVIAYRDGRGLVRYIKYLGDEAIAPFYGIVLGASTLGPLYEEDKLKLYRISGSGEEAIYDVDLRNDSPVTFEEASQNASKYDGSGIYEFTVNGAGEIVSIDRIEFIDLSVTNFMNESPGRIRLPGTNNSRFVDSAAIVALAEEDGKLSPKMLSWDTHLKNSGATGVTVKISYDPDDPTVDLMVLTDGWDTVYRGDPRYGLVTSDSRVYQDGDYLYKINLERASANESYIFSDTKYITLNALTAKKNSYIVYRTGYLYADNGIGLLAVYDLSGAPEDWQTVTSGNGLRFGVVDAVKNNYLRTTDQTEFMGMLTSDLQVYQIGAKGDFEKRMLADITPGMEVWYVYYNDLIRAIFFE